MKHITLANQCTQEEQKCIGTKIIFWWDNMKKEMVEYVNKYLTCQRVKAEYQRLVGKLRDLENPTWK